jgi:hypothetical protein
MNVISFLSPRSQLMLPLLKSLLAQALAYSQTQDEDRLSLGGHESSDKKLGLVSRDNHVD